MSLWSTRIADKEKIPLTTAGFNALVKATNTRLDDLDGMIARSEVLGDILAQEPTLEKEIEGLLKQTKAEFAQVMEDALFGIQTPLVGQGKGDDKLMHVKLPATVGELQTRLDAGWMKMNESIASDFLDGSKAANVFVQELFTEFTHELYDELEKSLGEKRVRSV